MTNPSPEREHKHTPDALPCWCSAGSSGLDFGRWFAAPSAAHDPAALIRAGWTEEATDQRIQAWEAIVKHSFFADCFRDGVLFDHMIAKLDSALAVAPSHPTPAEVWDECLDAIEQNELNTDQARAGNPYRGVEAEEQR